MDNVQLSCQHLRAALRFRGSSVAVLLLISVMGCGRPSSHGQPANAAPTSGQLLSEVLATLNNIDGYVSLEVRPPKVILDAKKSANSDIVQAKLVPDPGNPDGPCTLLEVVTKNSQFRKLGVQPGDFVRNFYVDADNNRKHEDADIVEVLSDSHVRLALGSDKPEETPHTIEVWRRSDEKLAGILSRLKSWVKADPATTDWEPSPDQEVLHQVIRRLNQVTAGQAPSEKWQPDPLLKGLPARYQDLPAVKRISAADFSLDEGRLLQEASWLRNIARRAAGHARDELDRAQGLFQWVVRNVQLESRESLAGVWRRPWQTLLYGRGTADDRTWLYILLCRQLDLDAVLLATPDEKGFNGLRNLGPAVLITGDNGPQLYLFDTAFGLPVPGPKGVGVATLAQAAADDAILRQLDLDAEHVYPWRADELKSVVALVAASPHELSDRMKRLEQGAGEEFRLTATVAPSTVQERLAKMGIMDVRLWSLPFETALQQSAYSESVRFAAARELLPFLWRPALWKARLVDFKRQSPQRAEPGDPRLREETSAEEYDRVAKELYMLARSDDESDANPPNDSGKAGKSSLILPPLPWSFEWARQQTAAIAPQHASFWLGQLALDRGAHRIALDYYQKRTLGAFPAGIWSPAARFNLSLAYLALNQPDRAVEWLEGQSTNAPPAQRQGDKLRARQLKATMKLPDPTQDAAS